MSNALEQLSAPLLFEHAKRLADAHRTTAARCRALGYEKTALLFERMGAACMETTKLVRASAALEGPALRVVRSADEPKGAA